MLPCYRSSVLIRYHDAVTVATEFEVLPAIDLRGGRVVRLRQGDFAQETAYDDDPAVVADRFAEAGARWLHVVDLDGARMGRPVQGAVIAGIVAAVAGRAAIEVAGGLRDARAVEAALAGGASRAVVGTAAVADPAFAGGLVQKWGAERIAVAIDVRDGRAVGHGWVSSDPGVDAVDAITRLAGAGVTTFEVTAIAQDGLLGGPDLALYRRMVGLGIGEVIASAGIASAADLRAVREIGCRGAIVGRALYEGTLALGEALAEARPT
jgi:phosphoribosylformimino-5-aminoimidazole carboxamide ribotide isomerase